VCTGHYQLSLSIGWNLVDFSKLVASASFSFWFKRQANIVLLSTVPHPDHVCVHLGQFRICILFKETSSQMLFIHPTEPFPYALL